MISPKRRRGRCCVDRRGASSSRVATPVARPACYLRSVHGAGILFYPWGIVLQVIAVLHFIRRRPDTFWLWIIIIGGGLGVAIYMVAEMLPDVNLLRGAVNSMRRRKRIRDLEAVVLENTAVGNLEELADLYLEERQFARARPLRQGHRVAIDSLDAFYRRGLAELELGDAPAALADLDLVVGNEPNTTSIARLASSPMRARSPASRARRRALSESRRSLDALRNLLQLRELSRCSEAVSRSEGLGAAHSREKADDAALPAAAGAAVVQQGECADQETAGGSGTRLGTRHWHCLRALAYTPRCLVPCFSCLVPVQAREIEQHGPHRRVVEIRAAGGDERVDELRDERGGRHRDAEGTGDLVRDAQILLIQLRPEARHLVLREHALAVHFEHAARRKPAEQRLAHERRIDAALRARAIASPTPASAPPIAI